MDRYTETEDKEVRIPIWVFALVGLAVLGVLAVLLIFFFTSPAS